jgi:arsenate reductase
MSTAMLKLYTLATCDSCRSATKWLKAQGAAFEEIAIRETPPSAAELKAMLAAYNGEVRKLFNTSGRDYRDQQLGEKLPGLSVDEALGLLGKNGNLVKRPFAIGDGVHLVGFNAATWTDALASRRR